MEEVIVEKMVPGGQGLAQLSTGKKAFVWGALPGETARIRIYKKKSSYVEAVAEEILQSSVDRILPEGPGEYLSTSPWQIMSFTAENLSKQQLLEDIFVAEKLTLNWQGFYDADQRYGYRNKMEYSFWWDNETSRVSLALHRRGSHMKLPLSGSVLASEAIHSAGVRLVEFINLHRIEARSLKSVILRSQADGDAAIVVFVVDRSVADQPWDELECAGLAVYYSNPKSPASVASELLVRIGNEYLIDTVLGREYRYSPEGFFQVNLPAYERALGDMQVWVDRPRIVDMYAGVGSVGMSLPYKELISVEVDAFSSAQARLNAGNDARVQIVLSESEKAIQYIDGDSVLVVDPPRAGLHRKVVSRILEVTPPRVLYLSCDPTTQARDIALLLEGGAYSIMFARGYNFFPSTPHIESLIVLERTSKSV